MNGLPTRNRMAMAAVDVSEPEEPLPPPDARRADIRAHLGARHMVLVGLPGAGKSSVGRRLAHRIGLPFIDADGEIEKAAGMAISEIFAHRGEEAFRDGEAKVIARLLEDEPSIIATGGGAFMRADTRDAVASSAVSVWLDASNEVLVARIKKRSHRPLFASGDAAQILQGLRNARDGQFSTADIHVRSTSGPHDRVVDAILAKLGGADGGQMPAGDATSGAHG